ncbi:MAG: hypothetical protein M2R45_03137 [Verrucomicrobia subdivision 3 bacterium]|nr:hypothetical protein [Limisphaerales bacterium]MCS1413205.1 hypothetical protein [Limisphaerales bacterium]
MYSFNTFAIVFQEVSLFARACRKSKATAQVIGINPIQHKSSAPPPLLGIVSRNGSGTNPESISSVHSRQIQALGTVPGGLFFIGHFGYR